MKKSKTTMTTISVITAFAVASIAGFQINEIIAEETEDKGYNFAEDTKIIAQFEFRDGTELYDFQVFTQKSGFDTLDAAVFDLERIVGDTPTLHEAADKATKYSRSSGMDYNLKEFDVTVLVFQGGDPKRTFNYETCRITDYFVKTEHDKEEGWTTSKGFAVKDKFELTCDGYTPHSPVYEKMMNPKKIETTTSTMDLEEPKEFWYDHINYESIPFGN